MQPILTEPSPDSMVTDQEDLNAARDAVYQSMVSVRIDQLYRQEVI